MPRAETDNPQSGSSRSERASILNVILESNGSQGLNECSRRSRGVQVLFISRYKGVQKNECLMIKERIEEMIEGVDDRMSVDGWMIECEYEGISKGGIDGYLII